MIQCFVTTHTSFAIPAAFSVEADTAPAILVALVQRFWDRYHSRGRRVSVRSRISIEQLLDERVSELSVSACMTKSPGKKIGIDYGKVDVMEEH